MLGRTRMLTIHCTLSFEDGSRVTGEMHAASPEEGGTIRYEGAVEKLENPPAAAFASAFEEYMKEQARILGAGFSAGFAGDYKIKKAA